jgi:hypothetical protein
MDRRKFCILSAAVAAGLAAETALPSAAIPLYKVIFDSRFAASRAFAMAAVSAGRATAGIRGDVTALWVDDLRLRWARDGGAIAGMTTLRSLFCLEQLAKDHWMRVIVRAEHWRTGAAASAGRVRSIVGGIQPGLPVPADPRLVSWVLA